MEDLIIGVGRILANLLVLEHYQGLLRLVLEKFLALWAISLAHVEQN